jgi:hypothetical protein
VGFPINSNTKFENMPYEKVIKNLRDNKKPVQVTYALKRG